MLFFSHQCVKCIHCNKDFQNKYKFCKLFIYICLSICDYSCLKNTVNKVCKGVNDGM